MKAAHEQDGWHGGRDASQDWASKLDVWFLRIKSAIRDFVAACEICQQHRPFTFVAPLRLICATKPMEHWLMDLTIYSFCVCLLIIDSFFKFAWAKILPNKESQGVAATLKHIFDTTGQPSIIQADNGGEFLGDVVPFLKARNIDCK